MKAKEYYKQYNEIAKDKGSEYALVKCLMDMFNEVKQIQKSRNAKSDSALISILNETNLKANSFIKRINKDIDLTQQGFVKVDAFKVFIKSEMKDLADLIGWS
jgi:hypothetical protein